MPGKIYTTVYSILLSPNRSQTEVSFIKESQEWKAENRDKFPVTVPYLPFVLKHMTAEMSSEFSAAVFNHNNSDALNTSADCSDCFLLKTPKQHFLQTLQCTPQTLCNTIPEIQSKSDLVKHFFLNIFHTF